MNHARLAQVYRALARLYPRAFRESYRDDMYALFCKQLQDENPWRVSIRAALDLAITIPTQHSEATMHRAPRSFVPLLYAAIASAGVMLTVAGGSAGSTVVGLCIAAVAATLCVISSRRVAPFRDTMNARSVRTGWWRFIVAGIAFIVAVIIGSGIGINAWNVGLVAVFAGLTCIGIGLVLAGFHAIQLVSGRPST